MLYRNPDQNCVMLGVNIKSIQIFLRKKRLKNNHLKYSFNVWVWFLYLKNCLKKPRVYFHYNAIVISYIYTKEKRYQNRQ